VGPSSKVKATQGTLEQSTSDAASGVGSGLGVGVGVGVGLGDGGDSAAGVWDGGAEVAGAKAARVGGGWSTVLELDAEEGTNAKKANPPTTRTSNAKQAGNRHRFHVP
jgi:hypothetical protein